MPLVVNEPKCPRCAAPVDWSQHQSQGKKRGIVALSTIGASFAVSALVGWIWGLGAAVLVAAAGLIVLALAMIPTNQARH